MMHRSHGRGTLLIDREFDGLRLRRASGTHDRSIFRQIDAMLTTFYSQGRHDLLQALHDKQFSPMYAFSCFKHYGVDKIPTADVLAPLGASWDAWVVRLKASADHKKSLRKTRRALGIGEHILNDLPGLLSTYRSGAQPHSANQARAHAQAFLRDTLGKSHKLWSQVRDMVPARRTKPRRKATILTPNEMRRLVVQLGPKVGEAAWSLAAMGLNPKEYWTDGFTEEPDRIIVHGVKREGRADRAQPRWTRVYQPMLGRSTFIRKLRKATGGRVIPKDFRNIYVRWCDEAGVSVINQKAYTGHGPRGMNELYKMGEVSGQLEADAQKLRTYTGEPESAPTLRRMA